MPQLQNPAEDFIRAFTAGRQMKLHEEQLAREAEERKLRQDLLKHQLQSAKVEDAIREHTLKWSNAGDLLKMMSGQPESELGSLPGTQFNPVEQDPTVGLGAAMGGPAPDRGPRPGWVPKVRQPVVFPASQELGLPGGQIMPRSQEETLQSAMMAKRMDAAAKAYEPYTLAPGAVRGIGGQTIQQAPLNTTAQDAAKARNEASIAAADRRAAEREAARIRQEKAKEDAAAKKVKDQALAAKTLGLRKLEEMRRTTKIVAGEKQDNPLQDPETFNNAKLELENAYRLAIGEPPLAELPIEWHAKEVAEKLGVTPAVLAKVRQALREGPGGPYPDTEEAIKVFLEDPRNRAILKLPPLPAGVKKP